MNFRDFLYKIIGYHPKVAAPAVAGPTVEQQIAAAIAALPKPAPAAPVAAPPAAAAPTPPPVITPPPVAPPAPPQYTGPFLNHDGQPDPLGRYTADTLKKELDWESTREVPTMPDSVSNQVLATFDAEPNLWIRWYHISNKEQAALTNRMTNPQQATFIGEYNGAFGRNIGVPPGWKDSACYRLRGD